MKKRNKILFVIAVTLIMVSICSVPAFALTEKEVEAAVNAQGRDAVTGNIFVWFLCAIAFLKVSQKIDSFLAGLGINVGHTGGSMMAEALIATRGAFMAKQFAGRAGGTGGKGASSGGGGGFMKGGLAGVVSRNFSNNAVKKATGNGGGGLGGKAFTSSVSKGGSFNNQLSALFNYACKYYGLSENPAKICGAMGKKKADKMLFWTLDEFKAFEKAVSDRVVTRTVFNLLYWSGMRSGEMMALTLSDFDFKGKAVDINKNYARLIHLMYPHMLLKCLELHF